jgi:hypothetical protein
MKRFIYSSFIFFHALDMSKILFCIQSGDICFTIIVLLCLIFNIILLGRTKNKYVDLFFHVIWRFVFEFLLIFVDALTFNNLKINTIVLHTLGQLNKVSGDTESWRKAFKWFTLKSILIYSRSVTILAVESAGFLTTDRLKLQNLQVEKKFKKFTFNKAIYDCENPTASLSSQIPLSRISKPTHTDRGVPQRHVVHVIIILPIPK